MQKEQVIESVKAIIEQLNSQINENQLFIVSISVTPANKITILADTHNGITIQECAQISRAFQDIYDIETLDYEIEVSSPGLGNPLIVKEQYIKNIGRELKIDTNDSKRFKGILKSVSDTDIEIESTVKKKKKDELPEINQRINTEQIKSAKVVINF